MLTLIYVIFTFVCIFLIITVLLQPGKAGGLGAAFGGGMGCLEGTCGALVGAEMVLGIKKYQGKGMHKDAAEVFRKFEAMCKATTCKDIKGRDTGIVLCSCDDCVGNAVEILDGIV